MRKNTPGRKVALVVLVQTLAICLPAALVGCRTVGSDIIKPVEKKTVEISGAVEEIAQAVELLPDIPEKPRVVEAVKVAQVKVEELKAVVDEAKKETARVEIKAQAVEKEIVKVKAVNKTLITLICAAGGLFAIGVFIKTVFF